MAQEDMIHMLLKSNRVCTIMQVSHILWVNSCNLSDVYMRTR